MKSKSFRLFSTLALLCVMGFSAFTILTRGQQNIMVAPAGFDAGRQEFLSPLFKFPLKPVSEAELTENEIIELDTILGEGQATFDSLNDVALKREVEREQIAALEEFVTTQTNSAWTPALHQNLAQYFYDRGYTSKALHHWHWAWSYTGATAESTRKAIADQVLPEWTRLLASLGRVETLAEVFEIEGHRAFERAGQAQKWLRTKEAYAHMIDDPGIAYRCGSLALNNVTYALTGTNVATFLKAESPETGFNVQQLVQLAQSQNLNFLPVFRESGEDIVVPSVVHWRENHYAAITKVSGDQYLVVDPTYQGSQWLTAEAINAEASGVFLVPQVNLPMGWRMLSLDETSQVFGRGYPYFMCDTCNGDCGGGNGAGGGGGGGGGGGKGVNMDKGKYGKGGGGGGGGAGGSGGDCPDCPEDQKGSSGSNGDDSNCGCSQASGDPMAQWQVFEPYINLWVNDTPLKHIPAYGPPLVLELKWKQRDDNNMVVDTVNMFGDLWHAPWSGYIRCDDVNKDYRDGIYQSGTKATTIEMYLRGSKRQFNFDASASETAKDYTTNLKIKRVSTSGRITSFEIHYPDGSKEIFAYHPLGGTFGNGGGFYLSQIVDPSGLAITINYSTTIYAGIVLIDSVEAADGSEFQFYYDDLSTHRLVTRVVAPGSRTVYFSYNGYKLEEIQDPVGITSTFTYDMYGTMTQLETSPYGITTFEHYIHGVFGHNLTSIIDRSLKITDPAGGEHFYLMASRTADNAVLQGFSFSPSDIPQDTPYDTFMTDDRAEATSYYWNPAQYARLSDPDPDDFNATDFRSARRKKWLGSFPQSGQNSLDTIAFMQEPSPDGTTEGQVTWYDYTNKDPMILHLAGDQKLPSVIARVQPDGTTWYMEFERADNGTILRTTEKWTENGVDYDREHIFEYDSNGIDLLRHYGPGGHLESGYGYSVSYPHLPVRYTNALNEITEFAYDGNNRLKSTKYPNGLIITNIFGMDGYVSRELAMDSAGNPLLTNDFTWSSGRLSTYTTPLGLVKTYTWDNVNRITQIDYSTGGSEKFYYTNGAGQMTLDLTAFKGRLGNWTYRSYTDIRQLELVIDPLNRVTGYEYCDCGGVAYITNALQQVTHYNRDYQGKSTIIDYPGGVSVTNVFTSLGQIYIVKDAVGSTTNHFDNLGRLIAVSNAVGQVAAYTYNNEDLIIENTDRNGLVIISAYDHLHRLRTRTYPDAGVESFGYTANNGAFTSYTNQIGHVTQYSYSILGLKTNEVQIGVFTNSFVYSPVGNLLSLTDGRQKITSWTYDAEGRNLAKRVHGNVNPIQTNTFDANGRITNRWTPTKGHTRYKYDAVGNLTNVNYNSSTDLSYAYDALNRLTNMIDAIGTSKYTYTTFGDLETEDGPWSDDTLTNIYSNAGLRIGFGLAQASGFWTNGFTYDAGKRLGSVDMHAGSFTYNYTSVGADVTSSHLVKKIGIPNTSYITNSYDNNTRLLETSINTSGHTTRNSHEYTYNTGNQRTSQIFTDGSYANYTYGSAGQLITDRAYTSGGTPKTDEQLGYRYDAAWNLLARTNNGSVTTFTVNDLNQVTNGPEGTMGYDGVGNPSTSQGGNQYWSTDDENQITQVFYYNSFKSLFVYDGKMRMRKRTEQIWDNTYSVWNTVSETRYIYDGMRVIQERNSSNVPVVSYTRGLDLSSTFESAGGVGGLLGRTAHSGIGGATLTPAYYHSDGNGNVTALVDGSQTLAANYRYDAYGRLLSSSGGLASANVYRYSSKEFHVKTETYYFGYRFYEPNLQRWMNRDPLGDLGFKKHLGIPSRKSTIDKNLYHFLFNSPTSSIDQFGLVSRKWPLNGEVCNCEGNSNPVCVLIDGDYFTLPPGQCTGDQTDADGYWVDTDFYDAGIRENDACNPKESCKWNGDPYSHNPKEGPDHPNPGSPAGRGASIGNSVPEGCGPVFTPPPVPPFRHPTSGPTPPTGY